MEKLAENGNAKKQFVLGVCYANGEGVEKDLAEAVKWYKKAAEQEYASAQYNLGVCYANGYGLEKNLTEAIKWYRKAAEQGVAAAQYNLGNSYYHGNGVEKDLAEAVKWYGKAAEQGVAVAQYNLGNSYYYGNGVEKDLAEAVKWYRKAAEQGDASAQNNLGWCYANGEGVEKNLVKADEWFKQAISKGNKLAKNNLKTFAIAKPFELIPNITTIKQVEKKYKLSDAGINKWTQGKMYTLQPISQIKFDGLTNILLIFDQKEVLQSVVAAFDKKKFNSLLEGLEQKYKLVYKNIPHVGNKKVNFDASNSSIELESPHLSFNVTLTFLTKDMSKLFQEKSQAQTLEKKKKEIAML